MSEWQPIETAPKDGTFVLTWSEHCGVGIGKWFPFPRSSPVGFDDATHWMPLPEPPAPLSGKDAPL